MTGPPRFALQYYLCLIGGLLIIGNTFYFIGFFFPILMFSLGLAIVLLSRLFHQSPEKHVAFGYAMVALSLVTFFTIDRYGNALFIPGMLGAGLALVGGVLSIGFGRSPYWRTAHSRLPTMLPGWHVHLWIVLRSRIRVWCYNGRALWNCHTVLRNHALQETRMAHTMGAHHSRHGCARSGRLSVAVSIRGGHPAGVLHARPRRRHYCTDIKPSPKEAGHNPANRVSM